jgi:hypothetical protein
VNVLEQAALQALNALYVASKLGIRVLFWALDR